MKNYIVLLITVFTFTVAQAQEKSKSIVETSFQVEGVCGMCKKRIEGAALREKGVKLANWDKKSQILKVTYSSKKTSEEKIQKAVADQGHETPLAPVDSTIYSKLPNCCKYKDGAECND